MLSFLRHLFFCILYGPLYDAAIQLPTTEWQTKNLLFHAILDFTFASYIYGPAEKNLSAGFRQRLCSWCGITNQLFSWMIA